MEVWRILPYAMIIGFYLMCSEYSGILANKFHMLSFYAVACV